MSLKRFPIGVQDFAQIRENEYFYVDKTDFVYKLTHTSQFYFLSRPRRFGKSLLVSTLQCYFEGRKELFRYSKVLQQKNLRRNGNAIRYSN